VTGKFDEYCVWTDDESSLNELDAEHFGQSVRERIDIAVRAKIRRKLNSQYFYDVIEETADDFLAEGQNYPENQQRFDGIQTAYRELLPAFRVLRDHIKDDRALDNAIRDVMWSAFLIGLACDRERLENPEILEKYSSSVTGKARAGRKESQDRWSEEVYQCVRKAIPEALKSSAKFPKLAKTTKVVENLKEYVLDAMLELKWPERHAPNERLDEKTVRELKAKLRGELDDRVKLAAIRKAISRYIDKKKMDASSSGVPGQDVS